MTRRTRPSTAPPSEGSSEELLFSPPTLKCSYFKSFIQSGEGQFRDSNWMDGCRMDGQTDGRVDRQTGRNCSHSLSIYCSPGTVVSPSLSLSSYLTKATLWLRLVFSTF